MELEKAFDSVFRDNLWRRMEELGMCDGYRVVAHRLYEKVRSRIRVSKGMYEYFGTDTFVKQLFPPSPTLFCLYIDRLEDWLSNVDGKDVNLTSYVMKLILFMHGIIIFPKNMD